MIKSMDDINWSPVIQDRKERWTLVNRATKGRVP
jgi:hypothetical protein